MNAEIIDLSTVREIRDYERKVAEGCCHWCLAPDAEYVNCNGDPLCDDCAIDPDSEEAREIMGYFDDEPPPEAA